VDKYTPVEIETSVDSEYGTAEHKNTVTYTYTDEKSGKQYEVELPYIRSEVISSGYVIPITLTGTLGDYSSEYFIYDGTRYSNPKDDISDIENLLVDFVTSAGYNSDDYRDFSYGYSGDAYYNADGILVRDFYVSFDIYGEKYRFYYGDTFDALVGTYSAECTYELDDTTKKELEEMKGQYEVTGNARYIRQTAVAKKKFYQTTVGKAVISAAVIFVILIIISLFIYLARGGRKSTDYRSRRDSERDYREL
jgi:hypothetical protein